MRKKSSRLPHAIDNLLTSGMTDSHDAEAIHRVRLLNFISITFVIFSIPLGIAAYVQHKPFLGMADHLVALIIMLNLLYLRKSHNHQLACFVGITLTIALFAFLFIDGGVNNTAHLWYYTFPLGASFLLGARKGAIATSVLLLLAIVFIAVDAEHPHLASYSTDFAIRFIPSFVVVFIFAFAFEYFRERADVKLTSKNEELKHTIEELKQTDLRLRKAQQKLEKRVQERTKALSEMNFELKKEINVRKRAEHDRRKLETQLAHSRKMEAIGTLAGGVAHDLNNILSGTVSYPDLILMDLPADSPLRGPILTIQKSGKKAAAIVQDLLTLARRGVVATEVVNLNHVIETYFDSPEFQRMKEFHPAIGIETHLEPRLLNIIGSPIHLSKTIMNMVNNSAEAMPDGGSIAISTSSEYIDHEVNGYDQINEGDYVVLTVSDTGDGIATGDLERIFDPFFTRKKMGRSGTGLGMAVVWGTVKDHNGYIDVQSAVGSGTTFRLFFPATRQEARSDQAAVPLDQYSGQGESVLVVDDVEDQRIIATGILKKLGYATRSAASGEEAIEFLKDHRVDLVVLDMIMDSAMGGLETYQRILERHPEQKAIIVSGYSENEQVKAVQRLGAGAYVKKPYTLEKLGLAVKAEIGCRQD